MARTKVLAVCTAVLMSACATPGMAPKAVSHGGEKTNFSLDGLKGVLWMQRAQECETAILQAYSAATSQLDQALADPGWTAVGGPVDAKLPPAVIVDVDETILDNAPYQAWLIQQGTSYSAATWGEWVGKAGARPLPGALEFARVAAARDVTIFYITNRSNELREATKANLLAMGFPLSSPDTQLLMKGQNGWTSSKKARREQVAKTHRVVLLIGDSLLDFLECEKCDLEQLATAAHEHRSKWGRQWITIPNPSYGSWESAAIGYDFSIPPDGQRRLKLQALEPWSGPTSP